MNDGNFYTRVELVSIRRAQDIKELQDIARMLIYRIRGAGNVRMICASLDLDDGASFEHRFRCLRIANQRQTLMGRRIFCYTPFVRRTMEILGCSVEEALHNMRYPFFYGFIHSGWIAEYYFQPNWGNSPFCRWVINMARQERHDRKIIFWSEE